MRHLNSINWWPFDQHNNSYRQMYSKLALQNHQQHYRCIRYRFRISKQWKFQSRYSINAGALENDTSLTDPTRYRSDDIEILLLKKKAKDAMQDNNHIAICFLSVFSIISDGNRPLLEPMLTYHHRCSVVFLREQLNKCSWIQFLIN